jgi:hypothetical protein
MEQWCSDCKSSKFYSEPSSSTSRSPSIDLPLPLKRSGPNLSSDSVRLLITLTAHEGWEVHHMNIKSTFLNGDL